MLTNVTNRVGQNLIHVVYIHFLAGIKITEGVNGANVLECDFFDTDHITR
jgi:hypothetical protein